MAVQFKKNGIIYSDIVYESSGMNLLNDGYKYTISNPYVLSGTSGDIIATTSLYTRVTPGETYYFVSKVSSSWADGHGYTDSRKGKATIWLYLLKNYDASSYGYDSPICFNSSNAVSKGVWKYTIPNGYNMARVRYNTYSNGTDTVTCKFWDTMLIQEKYYISSTAAIKVSKDYISAQNIYEF